MFCRLCRQEIILEKYIKGDLCFRCLYKKKLVRNPEREKRVVKQQKFLCCKICGGLLTGYKRSYCSKKCMREGNIITAKNFWVHKIRVMRTFYKNY